MRSKRRYNKKQQRIGTKKQKKNKRTRRLKRGGAEQWAKLRDKGYLPNALCPDPGVCIALGTYKDYISKYFLNFTDFSILNSAKIIGGISKNGMILELEYKQNEYTAHTVLKIPVSNTSDNTLYEALVGFFLNGKSLIYPSFLETYGLYKFAHDNDDCLEKMNRINSEINEYYSWINEYPRSKEKFESKITELKNIKIYDPLSKCNFEPPFRNAFGISKDIINDACKTPTNYAVLIQHLKDTKTVYSMLYNTEFANNDLLYILFQVYMTLSSLSDVFTHYDLHWNNVLVYEPVQNSYIEYHYHIGSKTIRFKSRYIAKIIDYGSCYFSPGFDPKLYEECKVTASLESFMLNNDYKRNSTKRNMSHDLRLIHAIEKTSDIHTELFPEWISKMPFIIFGEGIDDIDYKKYGTEENTKCGYPNQINNVIDAFSYLKTVVTKESQSNENDKHYNNMKKLGDLNIYDDGETNMNYVPFSELTTTGSKSVPV